MSDVRQILKDHATHLIRKGGYHAFSFRDLANLAGIKSSSVHYYFPTKSDLILEVIQDYRALFFKHLEENASQVNTSQQRILCLVALYENSLQNDSGCLCGILSAEFELLSPKECQALTQFFEQIEQWLVMQLNTIALPEKTTAGQYADLIMSALNGALVIDRILKTEQKFGSIRHFLTLLD